MVGRVTIAPDSETQRIVRERAEALGFAPDASLSSIYTELAAEGLRTRLRRLQEDEMARVYRAWADDSERLQANEDATEMAFADGIV